jgi:hypothetical protein
MLSPKTWTVIHRVYDNVHAALWAALCAAVLMFAAVVGPQIPRAQAAAQAKRLLDVAAENRAYCEKWGMAAGTAKQAQCLLDLQGLRAEVENRIAEDADLF